MTSTDSHPIRNGVIATVVGGIALAGLGQIWPPAKAAILWVVTKLGALISLLTTSYQTPGWLLLVLSLLSAVFVVLLAINIIQSNVPTNLPAYMQYKQDSFYGATWRWSWSNGAIENLWAYCPTCDCELVRANTDRDFLFDPRTVLLCEHCAETVATIPGGDHQYALSAVQRLIRRKARAVEQQERAS